MTFTGKNWLITGANTGLGLAVSKRLAQMGAKTILLCRNKERGENAIRTIKEETPDASVELMVCDLASLKSIQSFIEDFKNKYSTLDILYNNAAVMKPKRMVTEDGFEMMFQVNYLAQFIFMYAFIDMMKKSSSPFIVNNGRPADKYRLDFDDLQFMKKYQMYNSFFQTKLYLLFASLELAQRQKRGDISVTMIDPGPFKSDLVRDVPLMAWMKNLMSAPVEKATDIILYHITSDELKNINGKVFKEKKEYPLTEYWKDVSIGKKLWSVTESLIGKYTF